MKFVRRHEGYQNKYLPTPESFAGAVKAPFVAPVHTYVLFSIQKSLVVFSLITFTRKSNYNILFNYTDLMKLNDFTHG